MKAAILALPVLIASLAACATTLAGPNNRAAVEIIKYETGPCFGRCPVFKLTVDSNGKGIFEGQRFTAATMEHFTITPALFDAFRSRLRQVRPEGEQILDAEHCPGPMASDLRSVDVTWAKSFPAADGQQPKVEAHLRANYGCDMQVNRQLFQILDDALDAIPVRQYIEKQGSAQSGK